MPLLALGMTVAAAAPNAAAAAVAAAAAPAGVALVIGNASYSALPPLPACLTSAHAVAAALRRLHFTVVEQENATAGYVDGALATFSHDVQQADRPPTVVYSCGYAGAFNGRPFVLPTSAAVSRPADLLTQGVLARSLANAGVEAKAGPSLVVLDVAPMPGATADLGLASLARDDAPQLGLVAATGSAAGELPTPVATALVAALGGAAPVTVDGVLQAIRSAPGVEIAAAQAPAEPGDLAGAPVQAAAAGSPAARPAASARAAAASAKGSPAQAAAAPSRQAAAVAAPPATPTPSAAAPLPGEAQMTQDDRRQVQIALARLGYYDGKIDGIFGPDTRAAIRRWQFELHAPMTGTLTAAEANRLAGH